MTGICLGSAKNGKCTHCNAPSLRHESDVRNDETVLRKICTRQSMMEYRIGNTGKGDFRTRHQKVLCENDLVLQEIVTGKQEGTYKKYPSNYGIMTALFMRNKNCKSSKELRSKGSLQGTYLFFDDNNLARRNENVTKGSVDDIGRDLNQTNTSDNVAHRLVCSFATVTIATKIPVGTQPCKLHPKSSIEKN